MKNTYLEEKYENTIQCNEVTPWFGFVWLVKAFLLWFDSAALRSYSGSSLSGMAEQGLLPYPAHAQYLHRLWVQDIALLLDFLDACLC